MSYGMEYLLKLMPSSDALRAKAMPHNDNVYMQRDPEVAWAHPRKIQEGHENLKNAVEVLPDTFFSPLLLLYIMITIASIIDISILIGCIVIVHI